MKQGNTPSVGVEMVLKKAFKYWSSTIIYQLLFSLIYFSIFFSIILYFSAEYGLVEKYAPIFAKLQNGVQDYNKDIIKMRENPDVQKFNYILLAMWVFLFPLNIGFFQIYRKLDRKEPVVLNDLFAGYMGANFFKFAGYYLFWFIIFNYALPTLIFAILWVLITLFTAPLMFFMDKRLFECFTFNFQALKKHYLVIFVCLIVAFLFKYVGVVTVVLLPFTWPFMNAMIYTLYTEIFREIEKK